ncbi:ZRG17 [Candida theae]|uniref:ZRG17 n=1 Tax=Candida theae TaxID=1198502 RepID=A0AAD5BFX9_9ASCO|nr:ZRG17 [Candida theae]KAI5959338.1 ZRG17 [Candida theae]
MESAKDFDEVSSLSSETDYAVQSQEIPVIIESPTIHFQREPDDAINTTTTQQDKPKDLSFLTSANFSTDSLTESPKDSGYSFTNTQTSPTPRRYSNSSLSKSPRLIHPSQQSRSRPLSAFLLDSGNSIYEDESSVPFDNSPRSRDSFTFGMNSNTTPTFSDKGLQAQSYYASNVRPPSPTRSTSPVRSSRNYRSKSPVRRSSSPKKSNPFNFQPQEIMLHGNGSNHSLQVKPAHRKGHKYKHSSVSMNMFQEPPPMSANEQQLKAIPDSYPVPNCREALASVRKQQKSRLIWALGHLSLSIAIFVIGFKYGFSSLATLAHLVFYDSLGSLFIVLVDVMSNFEVWNNSSLAYPFGLERIEVLVSFALSASLLMLSFDLFSHFFEEFILSLISHDEHSDHEHVSHHVHEGHGNLAKNLLPYEAILVITLVVSLISSNFILAYDRINEMLNKSESSTAKNDVAPISNPVEQNTLASRMLRLLDVWRNYPTHMITVTYASFLVILPLIPETFVKDLAYDVNKCATILVAFLLFYNGWNLVKSLGVILLCSFPYSNYEYNLLKSKIKQDILSLDCFKDGFSIDKLFITKFNYQLYVIGVSISMKGADSDEEARMRFEVNKIINKEMQMLDDGRRKHTLEITIDINRF